MINHYFHNKEEMELLPEYALLGPRKIAGHSFYLLVRKETFVWEREHAFFFYQLHIPLAVWEQNVFFPLEKTGDWKDLLAALKKWRDELC